MGWLDDAYDVVTSPVFTPFNPAGAYPAIANALFPNTKSNEDHGWTQHVQQYDQRRMALRDSVVTSKEVDQFTREELLKQIDAVGNYNGDLNGLETQFANSLTSQDNLYVTRRAESNRLNKLQNAPGLAAQTILTKNVLGDTTTPAATPPLFMKGTASGGSTILT